MEQYTGKSVFQSIAIGPVFLYQKAQATVIRRHVEDAESEIERFDKAREKAQEMLAVLYKKAVAKVGQSGADIIEVHRMMLEDAEYLDCVYHMIRSRQVNAEFAVATTRDNFSAMFAAMDDAYMQARAADVKDISERLLHVLTGMEETEDMEEMDRPVILCARDLAPSETLRLDKTKLLAFVTEFGSTNSHTAILARNMGIPALVGIAPKDCFNGKMAIVDGTTGTLIIDPTQEVLSAYQEKKAAQERNRQLLQELKGKPTCTRDGKEIKLYANIGSEKDVAGVLANDAGGIGLFRSEFLYLEADTYPTEEAQFQIYRTVAEKMEGKKVIIRTLDIGADKQADYFGLGHEENPAMGLRAIRICLTRPEVFKTQLHAILRASVYGNLSVMFPMITSVWEIRKAKEILEEVKTELAKNEIPFRDVEIGVMIETPAAVMISDLLAKEVDFFSIGTNDLTQYTLAIDRQNQSLDLFYDPHHEAVLRMIEMTVTNGHRENIWVGICGELAADMELTECFLQMGVDELSVSPSYILPLRRRIGEIDSEGIHATEDLTMRDAQ